MNLAHAERRPAFLLPLVIAALLAVALGLAIAAFVVTLSDDEGGTTIVREVSVTPAAEAPAHFAERPDESAVAATVGTVFDVTRLTKSPFPGLEDKANSVGQSAQPNPAAQQYGTSQYRVDPSTGQATPANENEVYGWHDKP
jgi:hypothetical protein